MEDRITLNKNGYDPFIDYIKGLCILFIVLTHCFPKYLIDYTLFDLWGRTAVPILILLQVFHSYKRGLEVSKINIRKIWSRVAFPFFITEVVIFLLFPFVHLETSFKDLVYNIFWGGIGPGCYYPWIYIELAIIIPLCAIVIQRIRGKWLLITFILISQLFEILICLINLPEWAYRLTFFKYTFLIYLGYLLTVKGLYINTRTIIMSIISMVCILFFNYSHIDLRPFFCTQYDIWAVFHWICYFYIAYLFLFILKKTYQLLSKKKSILSYIQKMGKYSYEIFLFQLFYFSIIANYLDDFIVKICPQVLTDLIKILFAVIICVIPVVYYKDKTS